MTLTAKQKAYVELHIAVLLFGVTAILGELITLKEAPLVWHRLWITCLSLIFLPGVIKHIRLFSRKELIQFAGVGCVTCLHWLSFYGSIKYSNVSVALSCLATTTLFTSFLEPLLAKKRFNPIELFLGLLVVAGIWLIKYVTTDLYTTGILLGLASAFLASLFSTLNKVLIKDHNPIAITFVELGSGWIMLSALMPLYMQWFPGSALFQVSSSDWIYIIILALLCTSLAYVLALNSLKQISAFAATLSVNLEPVYGIILAALLFNEHKEMDFYFYIGTSIILLSVFLHPLLLKLSNKSENPV